MTTEHWLDLAKLVGIFFCVVGVGYLLFRQTAWTGIPQASRIKVLEDDSRSSKHRLDRLEENFRMFVDKQFETDQAILREIRSIREALTDLGWAKQEVEAIKDSIAKLDQELTTMPCRLRAELPSDCKEDK